MATFVSAPTVGVGSNNPKFGIVSAAGNFNPSGIPVSQDVWVNLFSPINTGTQRPRLGQIFPLGMFYGGVPSLMSSLNQAVVTGIGTTTTTVPSTTTEVRIRLWGQGGAGGDGLASGSGGGGGGGGGYCEGVYPVVPGSTLTTVLSITGNSTVTGMTSGTCSVTKGANGVSSSSFGAGGAGGTGTGGSFLVTGLHGLGGIPLGTGSGITSGAGGGAYGTCGGGTVLNFPGVVGQFPGGGGSGGSGVNTGGSGAAPACIIEWIQ